MTDDLPDDPADPDLPRLTGAQDPDGGGDDDEHDADVQAGDDDAGDNVQQDDDDGQEADEDPAELRRQLDDANRRLTAADRRANLAERRLRDQRRRDGDSSSSSSSRNAAQDGQAGQDGGDDRDDRIRDLEARLAERRVRDAFDTVTGHDWHDRSAAYALLDRSDVQQADGDVDQDALQDAADRLAERHPFLVRAPESKQKTPAATRPTGQQPGGHRRQGDDRAAATARFPGLFAGRVR